MHTAIRAMCLLAFMTIGYARAAERAQVISATPGSVELSAWCGSDLDPRCRQSVANVAQAHCRKAGRNAEYVRSVLMQRDLFAGEMFWFLYRCS